MLAITQTAFGGPEVLQPAEVARPRPLPTEVLVRMHATSVNPVELFIRAGAFPLLGDPPFILGWDVSGVVEEAVPGSSGVAAGDEVYGMPLFPRAAGSYAEYVAAPSRQLARKPRNLDHAQAAALPLVGLTAWQALVDIAKLQAGQLVLIHAAGGGVGHVAVQIAHALGAHVIGTASAGKLAFVRDLGADEVIDYQAGDFAAAARDVDVVFDTVGHGYAERSLPVLRPGGVLVTAVERANAELPAKFAAAGRRFAGVAVEPDRAGLERLTELVEAGKLRPHVSQTLPLREAARAHEILGAGSVTGKIVLAMG